MVQSDPIRVVDDRMHDVPRDGRTMGEIVMRGNTVMVGYFDDPEATEAAFRGGWLHSGDLGVQHSDGYVELRDRAKDIIISGGENISTVEIEHAIESHPAVSEAAVIGVPDEKWGERPKAFVIRKAGAQVDEAELIGYLKTHIARFKVPGSIAFVDELAAHLHRQDPEVRAPREGMGRARRAGSRDELKNECRMSTDMLADRTYDEDVLTTTEIGRSLGTDYFGLRDELTAAERDYLKVTRAFVDTEVLPVISGYWERAEFPWPLIKKMGALGIVGDGIEGYGCPPMSPVAAGLIHMELNRGDGSLGTIHAVQAGPGDALDLAARLRGAEEPLAAGDGPARPARGVRADRARSRLRRRGPGDHRRPRRRRLRHRRREALDRQRHTGRRDRGVGARHHRRPGQGPARREGRPRLRRAGHRGQGLGAGRAAGRHHPRRRPRPGRERASRCAELQGRRPSARLHPDRRRLGRARPRRRGLRGRAGLHEAARASSASRWWRSSSCRTSW